jgi:ectoine hydroxylase-related dioxygenase (phytanoyl-CoA dioxygenase family)
MQELLGEPVAAFDFLWLRAMAAGQASPLHLDHPYMSRGSQRLVTVWTPLGRIGLDEGPLFIVEGSHRFIDIHARFRGLDVDRDPNAKGFVEEHPIDLAISRGAGLLTTAFEPGDCMVFGMWTIHAALDNGAAGGKVRLSADTRFQPAAEPMDERFRGPDPLAHGGKGYACLAAARPLGEPLSRR